ncbi:MAG: restriction endonuclease subunit S [bacterium]|nr:restriction endonuclease subunit S [bacterium]
MVNHTEYKNTDVGVIPNDWDCISLYTLGELLSGLTYTPDDVKKYGLLVLRSSNIQNGRLRFEDNVYVNCKIEEKKYVKRGDLLICVRNGSRALIGKCALIDHDYNATFGAFMALFRSQYGEYLYQLFSSNAIQEQINRNCGATINQITSADFKKFLIAFPQKPKEQTAIAEVLSDADSLISSLQKLIEKKKAIKQGAMQELLTGKNRLTGFSGEWSEVSFADLFDFLPTNAFTRDQMTDTGTIQNIHYGDILTKYGACLDMANTDVPYLMGTVSVRKYSESSYARDGDVIIADTAEDSTVGKCVELVNVRGKALSGQHTMLCRPKISFAPKFLGYYMNAECFHNQMLPFITGIKVSSISKANISTLVLKYPTLVEEQQAIAQVLSDMDSEIKQLEKKLAKYQQIKQGMMQELLTGRIRLADVEENERPKTQAVREKQSQPAHNQHFDDAVMIAGIVNAFYSEKYPLGRKKVQKLLYLVRRKEQADISAFHKKAAGPHADEVRYKGGEPIAQKNKYIQVKRNEKGSCFEKGVQMQQALAYLQDWGKQADIDWLVSQFQYTNVNELELLATVDMAICDLRRDGKRISVASIKDLIHSNKEWRDKLKKAYFKDADIQRAIKKCQDLFES